MQALLLHWSTDDLFVLPELEDLEKCLREDYAFGTDIFPIPADNAHLELMMRIGQLIKEHESTDTLFVVYYGGHARIDESRQSRWCAYVVSPLAPTNNAQFECLRKTLTCNGSTERGILILLGYSKLASYITHESLPISLSTYTPVYRWSAIQTLLERSISDILILLDCCAGAASATFSTGNSITETISASSWDAIAPDPGRYSFTNALIEVLQEWRIRTFSAAMLHAEVLARLKHPRPIMINGKYFEARSTPVHFMMTSDHKAPSIEISRIIACEPALPSPPQPPQISQVPQPSYGQPIPRPRTPITHDHTYADTSSDEIVGTPETSSTTEISSLSEPNENVPHVMISLALEDDQRLDLNAWESWLTSFPALAKYVKVQGVFKSHSTLLLVSMPVMVWDLLPEDHATSFVAFIRSNNIAMQQPQREALQAAQSTAQEAPANTRPRSEFFDDNTTITPSVGPSLIREYEPVPDGRGQTAYTGLRTVQSTKSLSSLPSRIPGSLTDLPAGNISRTLIYNQHRSARRTTFADKVPEPPNFAVHIENRLEYYYQRNQHPSDADREFIASNLGIETTHVEVSVPSIEFTINRH